MKKELMKFLQYTEPNITTELCADIVDDYLRLEAQSVKNYEYACDLADLLAEKNKVVASDSELRRIIADYFDAYVQSWLARD